MGRVEDDEPQFEVVEGNDTRSVNSDEEDDTDQREEPK